MRKFAVVMAVGIGVLGINPPSLYALTITGTYALTSNDGPNEFRPPGHVLYIGATAISPSGPETTASAIHVGPGDSYDLGHFPSPLRPDEYAVRVPYTGQAGQWIIQAVTGAETGSVPTHVLDDPRVLPLAVNLQAFGTMLAPTLTWDPFDSAAFPTGRPPPIVLGTDFYQLRVRIRLAQPNVPTVFDSGNLPTTATSFTLPPGILQPNQHYLLSVMLLQFDTEVVTSLDPPRFTTALENRSETYQAWATVVASGVDIDPDTLNIKSKGRWITARIDVPGHDVASIDVSTIRLVTPTGVDIAVAPDAPVTIELLQSGTEVLSVKFDRASVIANLLPSDPTAVLTVRGSFADGAPFEGGNTIRVIH
jgi:hypothetical protein